MSRQRLGVGTGATGTGPAGAVVGTIATADGVRTREAARGPARARAQVLQRHNARSGARAEVPQRRRGDPARPASARGCGRRARRPAHYEFRRDFGDGGRHVAVLDPVEKRAATARAPSRSGSNGWPAPPASRRPATTRHRPTSTRGATGAGPVRLIVDYRIADGLRAAGQRAVADRILSDSIRLIEKSGFAERCDPVTAEPCGGGDFTWTAAMLIEDAGRRGGTRLKRPSIDEIMARADETIHADNVTPPPSQTGRPTRSRRAPATRATSSTPAAAGPSPVTARAAATRSRRRPGSGLPSRRCP